MCFLHTRPVCPTLSITVHLLVQRKLAGIVQNHELLQQTLDDLSGGGRRADVELLHRVRGQVEGCSLISPFIVCSLKGLWCCFAECGRPLGARRLQSGDRDWPIEAQVDLDEAGVGSIWSLKWGEVIFWNTELKWWSRRTPFAGCALYNMSKTA